MDLHWPEVQGTRKFANRPVHTLVEQLKMGKRKLVSSASRALQLALVE